MTGQVIDGVHVSIKNGFGMTKLQASDLNIDALGYVVDNKFLNQHLINNLKTKKNICIIDGCNVKTLLRTKNGGIVQIIKKNESINLSAPLTILADGVHSNLYKQIGFEKKVINYQQNALVSAVSTGKSHNNIAYQRVTDEGTLALLPLPNKRCGLVWTMSDVTCKERMELVDKDLLSEIQRNFGYRVGRFNNIGKRISYPLIQSIATSQITHGFLLLGSSAHHLHPIAAQGFNLCLRDIKILADVISTAFGSKHIGEVRTLETYINKRRTDQDLTSLFSHFLYYLFNNTSSTFSSSLSFMTNTSLSMLNIIKPAKKIFLNQIMGLSKYD